MEVVTYRYVSPFCLLLEQPSPERGRGIIIVMAKYYCMCQIYGSSHDTQDGQWYLAPNRYGPTFGEDKNRSVFLGEPMELVVMGAQQRVCFSPEATKPPRNKWPQTKEEREKDMATLNQSNRHYPDVDVYRCKNCGAEIIVE